MVEFGMIVNFWPIGELYNILRLTDLNSIESDLNVTGDRIPAIFINTKAHTLHISNNVNETADYVIIVPIMLDQYYRIKITQIEDGYGVNYTILINDEEVHTVINEGAKSFEEVVLFLSDTFYPSFVEFGSLYDLKIANIESSGNN